MSLISTGGQVTTNILHSNGDVTTKLLQRTGDVASYVLNSTGEVTTAYTGPASASTRSGSEEKILSNKK